MPVRRQRWDIFCRVVDNFGDIGVCWRLAKQLSDEHGLHVRLWVDDLVSTQKLLPELNLSASQQNIRGVEIHRWQADFGFDAVADVVIEAFACELPENYLLALTHASAEKQPIWLNLEYLSAEAWVAEFHLKPSPHPRLPLKKTFFFPGFTEKTGGLLREHDLFARRDEFQKQPALLWHGDEITEETITVSLFCYPHAPIHDLLTAMATSSKPVLCLIPESSILGVVGTFFGELLKAGDSRTRDSLSVKILPFLSQSEYDQLLWSCDLNFVRGEDSWIRAIWAAKPFIWLPYRQAEDTHLVKLNAFLQRYSHDLNAPTAQPFNAFQSDWAAGRFDSDMWEKLLKQLPGLQNHARHQTELLGQQADLAAKLVIFCENFS